MEGVRVDAEALARLGRFIHRGAESDLYAIDFLGIPAVLKWRRPKPYRVEELDAEVRSSRTVREASVLIRLREEGLPVPDVLYVSPEDGFFVMSRVEGKVLRDYLLEGGEWGWIAERLGGVVARMHMAGVAHGDLTTSNVIVCNGDIVLIDFGLASLTEDVDEKAVDIDLLYRVLVSTHTEIAEGFFSRFTQAYLRTYGPPGEEVYKRFRAIQAMGRYVSREVRAKALGLWEADEE